MVIQTEQQSNLIIFKNFFIRHSGDLGNVNCDSNGVCVVNILAQTNLTLSGTNSIIGRGFIGKKLFIKKN
jgi:hypothetical protein